MHTVKQKDKSPCNRVHKGNAGNEKELFISLNENKIDNVRMYNVILRRVRPTIVAMKKNNKYYIL